MKTRSPRHIPAPPGTTTPTNVSGRFPRTLAIPLLFVILGLTALPRLLPAAVQINEIMASNTRSFPDITDFEDYPDWIELKNTGNTSASLNGYFLSDDPAHPFKWQIPDGATIPAHGFLLFMADGHDAAPGQVYPRGYWPWRDFTTEKYHTNFNLSSLGETLTLTQATGVSTTTLVHAATPPPVAPATAAVWKYLADGSDQGTAWTTRTFNDAAWPSGPASLGYGDNETTTVPYGPSSSNKYITTYFRHTFTVADPAALEGLTLRLMVDDGCVVYLNGTELIRQNLPGDTITSSTRAVNAIGGSDETAFTLYSIPGASLAIGSNVLAVEVHQATANSSDLGFDLSLTGTTHTGSTTLDSVAFGEQVTDISLGRDPANPAQFVSLAESTPGAENLPAIVTDVRISGPPVTFSLPGGLYASNQSVTLTSPSGSIRYTLDGSNPKSTSALYSAPLTISATTVLRARTFEAGKPPGPIATRTWFRGETQPDVPVISLAADPDTLFGDKIGIYKNLHEPVDGSYGLHNAYKGKDAPANIEYFPPGGAPGFSAGCGIRIGGENNWVHPQKALNIAIRGKYGDDNVSSDLYPGSGVAIQTGITLRDGGDNWSTDMLREALWARLAHGYLKADTADYRPGIVFINGSYFGIHNIRQRWDETWFSEMYHLPADKIDHLIYGHLTSPSTTLGSDKGDTADWLDLLQFMDTADLTNAANWAYVESKIDMDSFMDFVISESWGNNTSWHHNREFWKEKNPGARWHWFLPDMDRTLFTGTLTGILGDMLGSDEALIRLKTNPGFKQRLAQRYAAHVAGTFHAARVQSIIAQMDTEISAQVPRHASRWAPDGMTVSRRNSNIQEMKDYATQRAANFAAEVSSELGVGTAVNFTLAVNSSLRGSVLVQGVPVDPGTFKMFPGAAFTLEAVPAPGFRFGSWTGITGPASTSTTIAGAKTITANFVPSGESVVGGTLATNTTLTTAGSPYTLSSDLIVPAGVTLTIQPGVTLDMPAQRNIRVQGILLVNGTAAQQVVIHGRDGSRWGGISMEDGSGPSFLAHLQVRDATKGYEPTLYDHAITGHNATVTADFIDVAGSDLTFYMYGGSCTVRDSIFYSPYTGDGIHVKRGAALIQRCTIKGNNAPDTDAIDFDGVIDGRIEDCAIYRFRGSNSDGIDIGEHCRNILIKGCIIYYNSDKGVSVGQGSTITMQNNLVVGCNLGVGIKDSGSNAVIDQNTFVSCGIGVDIYEKNFGAGGGSAVITNTILSRSPVAPVAVDGFSTASISYCLSDTTPLSGTDNLFTDPLFADPAALNFQILAGSPAIDAGDPSHPADPDSTRADIGASYVYHSTDYPYTIGETVVVNEILANSGTASDWIELHNRTTTPVAIGGWFLSDSASDLTKYRIPPGTVLPGGGYLAFYENTQFGVTSIDPNKITGFALSDAGETVYLSSAEADQLTDYQTQESFGPTLEGQTLGTYYKSSTDSWNFVAMQTPTPGAANSAPKVGPVVISEIMYHPAGNPDAEFVELLNISAAPVTCYDSVKAAPWRITSGFNFEFPVSPPPTLAAGERIVLVKNSAQFQAVFGAAVPAGTRIFEWTTGGLSNSGENIQLEMPGPLDPLGVRQFVREDRVSYIDSTPWPPAADGSGPSLTKLKNSSYGNDPSNWVASSATPGSGAAAPSFASWAASHGVTADGSDADGDGVANLLEYAWGTDPLAPTPSRPLQATPAAGALAVSFETDVTLTDLDYSLETSTDLVQWNPVATQAGAVVAGKQKRTYLSPFPDPDTHFYRLRVTVAP